MREAHPSRSVRSPRRKIRRKQKNYYPSVGTNRLTPCLTVVWAATSSCGTFAALATALQSTNETSLVER